MILYINTIKERSSKIEIILEDEGITLAKKDADASMRQAEMLLPMIKEVLKAANKELTDIRTVKVANRGGSFSSLRIGVVTANALAYALGIPVAGEHGKALQEGGIGIVEPESDREPNITKPRL
jgi:tRNA A37 threonylcarbamoyladenosine modification protein TsaB